MEASLTPQKLKEKFEKLKGNVDGNFFKETGVTWEAFDRSKFKFRIRFGDEKQRLFAALYLRHHSLFPNFKAIGEALGYSKDNWLKYGKKFVEDYSEELLAAHPIGKSIPQTPDVSTPSATTGSTEVKRYVTPPQSRAKESSSTLPDNGASMAGGSSFQEPLIAHTLFPESEDGGGKEEGKRTSVDLPPMKSIVLDRDEFSKYVSSKNLLPGKYVVNGFTVWKEIESDKNSLLVWNPSTCTLSTSDEFLHAIQQEEKQDVYALPRPTIECRASMNIVLSGTGVVCKALIPSQHCIDLMKSSDIIPVFHPSFGRPNSFPETLYNPELAEKSRILRIIVVDPCEEEAYAEVHLKRNCVVLIVPKNDKGIGYKRQIIQRVASTKGWNFAWMIDDSVSKFLHYDAVPGDKEAFKSNELEFSDFITSAQNRLFKFYEFPENDINSFGTMGCNKDRGGRGTKEEFKHAYASSAFLLNVTSTCARDVYFDPAHTCAEDICFHAQCVGTGLTCVVDYLHAVSKKTIKTGGAFNLTKDARAMAGAKKAVGTTQQEELEKEVDVASFYNAEIDKKQEISLVLAHGRSLAQCSHLSILPTCRGRVSVVAVSGCVDGEVHMHVQAAQPQAPEVIHFPETSRLSLSRGKASESSFVYPHDGCTLWKVEPGDGMFVKTSVDWARVENDVTIASVLESDVNSVWVASNKSDCRRIDFRIKDGVALHHQVKRGCKIVQLVKSKDDHTVAVLKYNGKLSFFDDRKLKKNTNDEQLYPVQLFSAGKKNIETILSTNSSNHRGARMLSLGERHLLTYTNSSKKRCGVLLSSMFEPVHADPLVFKGNADPAFSMQGGKAVLTEVYFSHARQNGIVHEWKESAGPGIDHVQQRSMCLTDSAGLSDTLATVLPACIGQICLPSFSLPAGIHFADYFK